MSEFLAEAQAFLDHTMLIDGHNDLPYVVWHSAAKGDLKLWDAARLHPETDTDLPRLKAGKVSTQIFTAFIPTDSPEPMRARREVIGVMHQLEQLYPDDIYPVLCPDDLAKAKIGGKIGVLKAVEGLVGLESLDPLSDFHAMGIRLITLCHNESLPFIDSATDAPGEKPLSAFGEAIIVEMERLGLLIDLAHVAPLAQNRVLDIAKGPVVNSHANAFALCNHPRNLDNATMKRIADGGGICMATFVPAFLHQGCYEALKPAFDAYGKVRPGGSGEAYNAAKKIAFASFTRDGVQHVCDHLDYMKTVIGAEAIGIGSDFYGGLNPPGLEDCSKFPAIFAELMRRRWKTGDLEKLAGGNFERVWRSVWRG
jgi:membrane dipeptidase